MSMSNTAQLVNVLTLQNKEKNVQLLIGKVTTIVMMATTMQDVNGMVVIAVAMKSTHNTAQFAPVWIRIIKDTTDTTGVGV